MEYDPVRFFRTLRSIDRSLAGTEHRGDRDDPEVPWRAVLVIVKHKTPRSLTRRTTDAGASATLYARFTELEDNPVAAALMRECFGPRGWRMAPLIEQEAVLSRIEGWLKDGFWTLDSAGRLQKTFDPERAAKSRSDLFR